MASTRTSSYSWERPTGGSVANTIAGAIPGLSQIQSIASIIGGLGGILGGRKKKSQNQILSEALSNAQLQGQQRLLPQQLALQELMLKNASSYNPDTANADLVRRIEGAGARNADLGQREVIGAAARNGASPGDSNTVVLRQRSLDNAWNPVGMSLAQIHADAPFKQMQMQAGALGGTGAGNTGYANSVTANYDNQPAPDKTASYGAFANGIEGLLTKKKKPVAMI